MKKLRGSLVSLSLFGFMALTVLILQVFALITLEPIEFGVFSTQYLLYAFAISLSLSVISDAWLRRGKIDSWASYSSVLMYFVIGFGGVSVLLISFVPILRPTILPAIIAVMFATYRGGSRFYALVQGNRIGALAGDILGLISLVISILLFYFYGTFDLNAVVWSWAVSSVCSVFGLNRPHLHRPSTIADWFKSYWGEIKKLLPDSLLMDASSIGTPYLLIGFFGFSNFGIYRAVSNVAAPVRLVLSPLRPIIANYPMKIHRSTTNILMIFFVSQFFGWSAFFSLYLIEYLGWQLGTINALLPFVIPTALFVAANFYNHYYYMAARSRSSGKQILVGRIIQTSFGIVLPISGVLIFGLPGAIWGYTISIVISGVSWALIVILFGKDTHNLRADFHEVPHAE